MLRRIPLAIRQTGNWLRRDGVVSHRLRLLVLFSFAASSFGIPVGDWSLTLSAENSDVSPWCRCSESSRRSGKCCCSKSTAGATGGCCSTRKSSTATTRSATPKSAGCCSTKKGANREIASKSAPTEKKNVPAWRSCGCGPTDSPQLLVNNEPRILSQSVVLVDLCVRVGSFSASNVIASGQRSRPLLPPPKSPIFG